MVLKKMWWRLKLSLEKMLEVASLATLEEEEEVIKMDTPMGQLEPKRMLPKNEKEIPSKKYHNFNDYYLW